MRRLFTRLHWKPLLGLLALLCAATAGAWLGWLTYEPTPRLELRAEDELHACFFSDDGTELVTEFRSAGHNGIQRGFIAWDMATGRENERWVMPAEVSDRQLDPDARQAKHRVFSELRGEQQMVVSCYQVRPWKLIGQFRRNRTTARLMGGTFANAHMPPSADVVLLNLLDEEAEGPNRPHQELWDLRTGKLRAQLSGAFSSFSPDGTLVATVYNDELRHWRLPSGEPFGAVIKEGVSVAGLGYSDKKGNVLIRSTAFEENQPVLLRRIDIGTGRVLSEARTFDFNYLAPDCEFGVGLNSAALGECKDAVIFRWRPLKAPEILGRWPEILSVRAIDHHPEVEKTGLICQSTSWSHQGQFFGWLVQRGWLRDNQLDDRIVIVSLRRGKEELRFRTALAATQFVLSLRGDLLACEAKLDPSAAAPRADTGEFPSFVQVWDLPAAFPWLRMLLFSLLPPLTLTVAWLSFAAVGDGGCRRRCE